MRLWSEVLPQHGETQRIAFLTQQNRGLKGKGEGTGEIAQWLGTLTALAENLSSIPSIQHGCSQSSVILVHEDLVPSSGFLQYQACTLFMLIHAG